jgi:hypothetical protein
VEILRALSNDDTERLEQLAQQFIAEAKHGQSVVPTTTYEADVRAYVTAGADVLSRWLWIE